MKSIFQDEDSETALEAAINLNLKGSCYLTREIYKVRIKRKSLYMCVYIHVCVSCMYVCTHTHIYTHTHINIDIHIYIYVYMCVYVCTLFIIILRLFRFFSRGHICKS